MPPATTTTIPAYTLDPEDRNFTLRHAVNLLDSLTSVIDRNADPDLHDIAALVYADLTSLGDVFVTDKSADTTLDTIGSVERWLKQQKDIQSVCLERQWTGARLSSEEYRVLERAKPIINKVTELKRKLLYIVDTRLCVLEPSLLCDERSELFGHARLHLARLPTYEDLSARRWDLVRDHEWKRRCTAYHLAYPDRLSILDSRQVSRDEIHNFYDIQVDIATTPAVDRMFTLLRGSPTAAASDNGTAESVLRVSSTSDTRDASSSTEGDDLFDPEIEANIQTPLAMASLLTIDIRQHADTQTEATEAQHADFLSSLRSCMSRT